MQMTFCKQLNAPINIVRVWDGKEQVLSKNMACPSYFALIQQTPSTFEHAAQADPSGCTQVTAIHSATSPTLLIAKL